MVYSIRRTCVLLVLLLLAGCSTMPQEPPQERTRLANEQNTVDIVQAVSPSVVTVNISQGGSQAPEGESAEERRLISGGSGFVVDEAGHIITNYHVVAGVLNDTTDDEFGLIEDSSITVAYLRNPEELLPVRVLGANPDIDLALLELVNPEDRNNAQPVPLSDSDEVAVGEKTIAIGNPFGLHSSVTSGIVSAVEREQPGIAGIEIPYIQTDAAINPGNSGGPLLNSEGEAIGINNAILSPGGSFAGVGLAVPSNLLRDALADLRAGGYSGFAVSAAQIPERPRLGLQIALTLDQYPPSLRRELNLPDSGVVVTGVSEGGPAARAGIRGPTETISVNEQQFPAGMDVITAINGQPVSRAMDLQRVVLAHDAGETVTLTLWRNGSEREVDVTLEVVPTN